MFAIFLTEGMDPFYQNISSFPTVFFTFFLLLCLLYWLIAILGVVEIDALDFDIPDPDADLGVVDANNHISNPGAMAGLMLRFGLSGVPVTIIVSLVALFGWIICYYAVHLLFAIVPNGFLEFIVGIPVLLGSFYLAILLTAQTIKPLRPLFRKTRTEGKKYLIGQTAVVRTSRVDNNFGEATLEDGGAGLILKVRSTGNETFKSGDRVVLLQYDNKQGTYRVISETEFTNG